jgi:hypothetical protein
MRRTIALAACLSAFALVADAAANRLEFYFSTQGDLSGIPAEYVAKSIPTIVPGQKVYLWTYVQGTASRWGDVSLKFAGPVCTGGLMYDPVTYDPDDPTIVLWRRWNLGGDKDPVGDNYVRMVAVPNPQTGLGDATLDYLCTGTTRHFLIGEMQFNTSGSIFMAVGTYFILKMGTANPPTDDIYFGFSEPAPGTKEHIVKANGQLAYGTDIGASTPTPDLYIIPEPAAWLVVVIAGAALRRR